MENTIRQIEISEIIVSKLFGALDANAKVIENLCGVRVDTYGGGIKLTGDAEKVKLAEELTGSLIGLIKQGEKVNKVFIERCYDMITSGAGEEIADIFNQVIAVTAKGKKIFCKTIGQRNYCREILRNTLVFGVGPAGTGKTYLAVACAVAAYKRGQVDKIILTRPAIEAGEKLGFLPGDLQMKVDPYLRPLYDALEEMFGVDNYMGLIERGIIEIAPLAYMRGRTLSRAFIILDEAQNTTEEQMKMFLTRMGEGSRVVVTGDITQIDLPAGGRCGLKQAIKILDKIDEIAVCYLTDKDVVRHELVQKIVKAYEKITD